MCSSDLNGGLDRHALWIRGDYLNDAIYDPEGDESATKPRRPGLPVEPRRVVGMLLPHSKRLGKALLGAALVSAVAFYFLPKTFKSQAVLYYEGTPLLDKTETSPVAVLRAAVAPSRLREVRARLGVDVSLSELGKHVSAESHSKKSIRLEGSASTADDAYTLAQTLLDVFLDSQAAFNAKKLDRLSAENDASLKRAVERRDAAQAAFDEFRKKSGKPDLLDEKEHLLSRAAGLRVNADEAAVEIAAQRALIGELEAARDELPRQIVSSATRGGVVDAPLARARADLAEARATLSEEHPQVQALKGKVARLQAQRGGQRAEIGEQTMMANPARNAVDEELATARPEWEELGTDTVDEPISWTTFGRALLERSERLKPLLMDPTFLVGLGQIDSDEILFLAGLRYNRTPDTLSTQEIRRLSRAVVEVVHDAVKYRGTTLEDNGYADLFGEPGSYQDHLAVYGKAGEMSARARGEIVRSKIGGQWTYYCEQTQG